MQKVLIIVLLGAIIFVLYTFNPRPASLSPPEKGDRGEEEEGEPEESPSLGSISLGSFSVGDFGSYKSAEVDSTFSLDDLAQAWTGNQEEDEFSFY